jgi:hypothetical protein
MLAQVKNGFLLSALTAAALGFCIAAPVQAQTTRQSDVVYLNGASVLQAIDDPNNPNAPQFFPAFAPAPAGTTVSGINLYELAVTSGTISDQIWIQPNPAAGGQLYLYFSSDPFVPGQTDMPSNVPVVKNLVEDGTIQDVSQYFSASLPSGSIAVQSDLNVPEPGTLGLLGAGAVGLLAFAWRKRNVLRSPQL